MLTVKDIFNKRNDLICAKTYRAAKNITPSIQRENSCEKFQQKFISTSVEIGTKLYQQIVLEGVVKQLNNTLINREH